MRCRNKMFVTLGDERFAKLDRLAREFGFVHDDEVPRYAEMIRVLLVASITSSDLPRPRVARALYCNSILALSGDFAAMLSDLREDFGRMSGRVAQVDELEPEHRPRRLRSGPRSRADRACLTIDGWLRHRIEDEMAAESDGKERAADLRAVLRLLDRALGQIERHRIVIEDYLVAISQIRQATRRAIQGERDRLQSTLGGLR